MQMFPHVLYLTVPMSEVDINVHPTKHEVRFTKPRMIHDFIAATIRQVLAQAMPASINNNTQHVTQSISEPYTAYKNFNITKHNSNIGENIAAPAQLDIQILSNLSEQLLLAKQGDRLLIIDLVAAKNIFIHDKLLINSSKASLSKPIEIINIKQALPVFELINNHLFVEYLANNWQLTISSASANAILIETLPQLIFDLVDINKADIDTWLYFFNNLQILMQQYWQKNNAILNQHILSLIAEIVAKIPLRDTIVAEIVRHAIKTKKPQVIKTVAISKLFELLPGS